MKNIENGKRVMGKLDIDQIKKMENMKKKILLVNPYSGKINQLPLGLLSLARCVNRDRFDVEIIDNLKSKEFKVKLESIRGEILCIAIAAMIGPTITEGLTIAKEFREKHPNAKIIFGGWHPTLFPEQTAKHELVDICVVGYAEETFNELVESLDDKRSLDNIKGLWFKKEGKIISTPPREIPDPNSLPKIPYELVDVEKYIIPYLGKRTMFYNSSLGCPFRCGFCAENMMSKRKWKALSSERVIKEVEELVKRYNLDSIAFQDNNFFVNMSRVKEICHGFLDKKLEIIWDAFGRPDQLANASDEDLELIRKSGCVKILIGAESGSDRVMKIITKDSDVNNNFIVAKKFAKHNILIKFSMMIGVPGETEEESEKTIKMAGDLVNIWKRHQINFFFYTPFPGSPLYQKALELGFKEPKNLEEWGSIELHKSECPWINKKKYEKLVNLYIPLCFLKPDFVATQIKRSFKIPLYVGHFLAKLRYKLNFYWFPFEWWVYKILEKKIGVIY